MILFNFCFAVLLCGMTIYHLVGYIRHHRPYRLFFLLTFGFLFVSHLARSDDLTPIIAATLIIAVVLRYRELLAMRRLINRIFKEDSAPAKPPAGGRDEDLDG